MPLRAIMDSIDDLSEDIQSLYTEKDGKYELTGIEGIKTEADISRVQNSLVKERNDHKETKTKLSSFRDIDANEIHSKLDRLQELEAIGGTEGIEEKIKLGVDARLKSLTAPLERENKDLKGRLGEADQTISKYKETSSKRKLEDAARSAFVKLQLKEPSGQEDAMVHIERIFTVSDDDVISARSGVAGVEEGIDIETWLIDKKQSRGHWWGETIGGGAHSGGRKGSGSNPWSADNWNMTEQNKIFLQDRSLAEKLAKQAGTKIGGTKPKKN